jgi:hypothetical protein
MIASIVLGGHGRRRSPSWGEQQAVCDHVIAQHVGQPGLNIALAQDEMGINR